MFLIILIVIKLQCCLLQITALPVSMVKWTAHSSYSQEWSNTFYSLLNPLDTIVGDVALDTIFISLGWAWRGNSDGIRNKHWTGIKDSLGLQMSWVNNAAPKLLNSLLETLKEGWKCCCLQEKPEDIPLVGRNLFNHLYIFTKHHARV